MTQEEYEKMSYPNRAEWIKSEVAKSIANGSDIKLPIYQALLMENYTKVMEKNNGFPLR